MNESIEQMMIRHEGCVLHAYEDSEGYLTIGIGRLIDKRRGGGITEEESRMLFRNDLEKVKEDLSGIFTDFDMWLMQPSFAGIAKGLISMRFQLGASGFRSFSSMIQAIQENDWDRAADEALNSLWAQQTPERAREVAEMIRNGG